MDLSRTSDSDESLSGGSELSHESLGERKVSALIWSLTVTRIWLIFPSREQFALALIKLFAKCSAKIVHLIGQHCLSYSKRGIVYGRECGMNGSLISPPRSPGNNNGKSRLDVQGALMSLLCDRNGVVFLADGYLYE